MKVICPHCNTVFKLTEEQLEIADGMVRCGMCQEVFNGLHNLEDPFDDGDSSFKSTFDNRPRPAIKTVDKPRQEPGHDTNNRPAAESIPDEPVQEIAQALSDLSSNQPTSTPEADTAWVDDKQKASSDLFDGAQSKLIPDEFRIPELDIHYSIWKDLTWSFIILLLTISLFIEYLWFNRNDLIADSQINPYFTSFCDITDCESLGLRDKKAFEILARNIYSHPNASEALMISVTIVNHASFSQPYPNVQVDFSDVRGDVVATRVFTPEEYLQIQKDKLKSLPPELQVDFSLEIKDPGPQAMTYEFDFI